VTATIVDVGALWQTVWSAALGGLLVTVCCSVAVLGAARTQEHRKAGNAAVATSWTVVALAGGLAMAAVILYGLLLVVD
jgi:hypothetical protein